MSGWDWIYKALRCLPSDGGISACAPQVWGLCWWREKVFPTHGMSSCRSSETTSPQHNQGTVAGDDAQPCRCHPRSGCLWHSAGSPGSGSQPRGPLPQGCSDRPPHPPMETQARLSMSTNRLHQSLAPACRSPLPRVPPRMLTRGFEISKLKPTHIFRLSPPGQRALRVRAHARETLRLGMVCLYKIFKPQQTHCNEEPLSPPKQPNFPLASGIFPLPPSAVFPQTALLGDYFHQHYIQNPLSTDSAELGTFPSNPACSQPCSPSRNRSLQKLLFCPKMALETPPDARGGGLRGRLP